MTKTAAATNTKAKAATKTAPADERKHERSVAPAAAIWMNPTSLKPWKDNPRSNDGEPVKRVAASIKRFGFGEPIVARSANHEIIAGHTRWKAALQLRLGQVPVRLLDLSEHEAHLLALADNRLGELAEWNASLGDLLAALQGADAFVAGWTQADMDQMTAELSKAVKQVEVEAPRLDRPGETGEHMERSFICPKCGYDSKSPPAK